MLPLGPAAIRLLWFCVAPDTELDGWPIRTRLPGGNVGEAYHLADGRVLKILREELALDAAMRERFAAEIRSQRAVDSPFIPRVYDVGEHEGRPYFVMEHRPGVSLAVALEQDRALSNEAVGVGVLNALADCHASGIVHRDLKPDNVIVAPAAVSLIDFGVSCASATSAKTGARASLQWGAPSSWGPERLLGFDGSDVRSELFSAGVVLFTLLAREHPFGHPAPAWRELLTRCEPPPLRAFAPEMSMFDGFFRRALAKEMDARFRSALAMRDAWQEVCKPSTQG